MERPASAIRSLSLGAIAAALSVMRKSPTFELREPGRRRSYRISPSIYTAGGPNPNVRGTYVRNPFIAEQVNALHEKWLAAKQERDARRQAGAAHG